MKGSQKKQNALISRIDKASNSKELSKVIDSIAASSKKRSTGYLKSGKYTGLVHEYGLMANAYSRAAELIENSSRFPELREISSSFHEIAIYWKNRSDASLKEGVDKYRNEAYTLQQAGNYRAAGEQLDKALELDPSNSNLWNDRGNQFFSLRELAQARQCYEKAIQIDPKNVFALTNMGLIMKELENYPTAIDYFNKAIEINPDYEEAFLSKGDTCFYARLYEDAKNAYARVIEINEKSARAWNGLGATLSDGFSEYKKARECLEKAVDLQPIAEHKANLAELLLLTKEYDKSEKLALEVRDNAPDEDYGFAMRLLLVISPYLRGEIDEATAAALDLIKHCKTVSLYYKCMWTSNALKKMIEESNLPSDVKEVLIMLASLTESAFGADRIEAADKIQAKILATRSSFKSALGAPVKFLKAAIGGKKITDEDIKIVNTSSPDSRPGYYNWEIHLEAPENILTQIKSVKYTLHPTFTEREVSVHNMEKGFKLERSGWGEFNVRIDAALMDGRIITKYHWLKLT